MDARWNNPDRVCFNDFLSWEQMHDARLRHALDNGPTLGSATWRSVLLNWYHELFTNYSIDGIYIDSVNEDNDLPQPERGNLIGIHAFLPDLRLLVDEFTNDRVIVLHMLGQDATPHGALGDYMLPRCPPCGTECKADTRSTPAMHSVSMRMPIYRVFSETLRSGGLTRVNQLMPYPLSPWLSTYLARPKWALSINEPTVATAAYRTYRQPVIDFCAVGSATVRHFLDEDSGRSNPELDVQVCSKRDESLIVVTFEEPGECVRDIWIHADALPGGKPHVRPSRSQTVPYRSEREWLRLGNVAINNWPQIIRVSPRE